MKILSTVTLFALTLGCAATAFAGGNAKNNKRAPSTLLPGEDAAPLPVADTTQVEIRRATAVMDPHDQTRISSGSLWKDGVTNEAGMFADRRARRRGDVLTIIVSESVNLANSITQQTGKTNSVANPVLDSYLLNLPKNLRFAKQAAPASASGTAAAGTNPSISGALGLTTSYSGTATFNNQQSLDSRATVTVTDVLPNGNLVIEGTRVISFSGENKFAEISGIVRQDDITPDNTILSTNIGDAKVMFHSEGSLTDAQKKGWLSRSFDHFNPL